MRLLVATSNPNKVREIRPLLAGLAIELVTLADVPGIPEPEETGATFWENARIKAHAYAAATGLPAVAEDSGLEIAALGGEPGVRSARYLGAEVPYETRFAEIYRRLAAQPSAPRDARFVTALALARGREVLFETEAVIDGVIAPAPAGANGFGYDPIFFYPPFGQTTAEMTLEQKAAVSHRGRAFRTFAAWLRSNLPG
ncbi:MAG: RdgB/HAM1 family non-canonical purine NTP pyrophosphatase [Acidobacteriota bacterium]